MSSSRFDVALILAGAVFFGVLLGKHLSYPLFWADEAETAMFARRVLEHGYPIAVAVAEAHHHGIDTPEQFREFVRRCAP